MNSTRFILTSALTLAMALPAMAEDRYNTPDPYAPASKVKKQVEPAPQPLIKNNQNYYIRKQNGDKVEIGRENKKRGDQKKDTRALDQLIRRVGEVPPSPAKKDAEFKKKDLREISDRVLEETNRLHRTNPRIERKVRHESYAHRPAFDALTKRGDRCLGYITYRSGARKTVWIYEDYERSKNKYERGSYGWHANHQTARICRAMAHAYAESKRAGLAVRDRLHRAGIAIDRALHRGLRDIGHAARRAGKAIARESVYAVKRVERGARYFYEKGIRDNELNHHQEGTWNNCALFDKDNSSSACGAGSGR